MEIIFRIVNALRGVSALTAFTFCIIWGASYLANHDDNPRLKIYKKIFLTALVIFVFSAILVYFYEQ